MCGSVRTDRGGHSDDGSPGHPKHYQDQRSMHFKYWPAVSELWRRRWHRHGPSGIVGIWVPSWALKRALSLELKERSPLTRMEGSMRSVPQRPVHPEWTLSVQWAVLMYVSCCYDTTRLLLNRPSPRPSSPSCCKSKALDCWKWRIIMFAFKGPWLALQPSCLIPHFFQR